MAICTLANMVTASSHSQGTASVVTDKDVTRDTRNARALGDALALCMAVPWGMCGIFYTGRSSFKGIDPQMICNFTPFARA